jgi:hypothetical protein
MEMLKHSKVGIISFLVALMPIIYAVIITVEDILFPINSGYNMRLPTSIMISMFVIALIGLILGIIAIAQKGYKKVLPICSVIISLLILSIPIILLVKASIDISNMKAT